MLFIFVVNVRINPNFFRDFGGNNIALGLLSTATVLLGVLIVFKYCCLFFSADGPRGLPVVINALCNTIAGAPNLNTTGRTLLDIFPGNTPDVTGNCTYTCPLNIINVVNTAVLVGCVAHMSVTTRRRRLGRRRTTGPRTGPRGVRLHIRGTCVTNEALERISRFLGQSVIYSELLRSKRIDVPGDGAAFRMNSRLLIIYTRTSTRTVGTFVNPRVSTR